MKRHALSLALALAASYSGAQFFESEPNDTKATANIVSGMVAGNTITGHSMGNQDIFRVSTAAAPPAIYQHRLRLWTSMPGPAGGHFGQILGRTQSNGIIDPNSHAILQTTGNPRFNQWYGFGKQESIYYQVRGDSFTEADYVATLETEVVTPHFLGTFVSGQITITTVDRSVTNPNTDLWIYDANFNAIEGYGNDRSNAEPPFANNAALTRTYAPGTYYLALSNYNLANNLPSPADDGNRNGPVLDFADALINSTTSASDLNFGVIHAGGTSEFLAQKPGFFGVYWARFDVAPVPERTTMAALALGVGLLLRRRKK
jgi:hypothetical protein